MALGFRDFHPWSAGPKAEMARQKSLLQESFGPYQPESIEPGSTRETGRGQGRSTALQVMPHDPPPSAWLLILQWAVDSSLEHFHVIASKHHAYVHMIPLGDIFIQTILQGFILKKLSAFALQELFLPTWVKHMPNSKASVLYTKLTHWRNYPLPFLFNPHGNTNVFT